MSRNNHAHKSPIHIHSNHQLVTLGQLDRKHFNSHSLPFFENSISAVIYLSLVKYKLLIYISPSFWKFCLLKRTRLGMNMKTENKVHWIKAACFPVLSWHLMVRSSAGIKTSWREKKTSCQDSYLPRWCSWLGWFSHSASEHRRHMTRWAATSHSFLSPLGRSRSLGYCPLHESSRDPPQILQNKRGN